jgi:hypothetical protein
VRERGEERREEEVTREGKGGERRRDMYERNGRDKREKKWK